MVSVWLMDSTSQPIGITILRHHSTGNQRYGYFANNDDPSNAPGAILIRIPSAIKAEVTARSGALCGQRGESHVPESYGHESSR